MKKALIGVIILFSAVIINDAVLQNAKAQDNQDCQSAAETAGKACQSANFECFDSCKPIKDRTFYDCHDACRKRGIDCYQARNDAYDACLKGIVVPPVSDGKNAMPDDNLLEEVEALIKERPSENDFTEEEFDEKEIKLREGSDKSYLFGTPYGPFIERVMKEEGKKAEYGIQVTRKKGGNPEIILPDGSKLDYTYASYADLRQIPPGAKIITPPGVEVRMKFSLFTLPESMSGIPFATRISPEHPSAIWERSFSMDIGENSELTVEELYQSFVKVVVNKGYVRFKKKLIPLQAASQTGVGCITKGTDFGIGYDPDTKQTIAEIYDGTIDVVDLNTEKTLATLSTSYGGRIDSVEVAEDKTIIKKIAVPQSEWPAFIANEQKNGSSVWMWVLIVFIIGGIGYLVRHKREKSS